MEGVGTTFSQLGLLIRRVEEAVGPDAGELLHCHLWSHKTPRLAMPSAYIMLKWNKHKHNEIGCFTKGAHNLRMEIMLLHLKSELQHRIQNPSAYKKLR